MRFEGVGNLSNEGFLKGLNPFKFMNCKFLQTGQQGAILLLMMVMVEIMGLAAGMAGQSWRSTMQREREAELLWRGQQYQQAYSQLLCC